MRWVRAILPNDSSDSIHTGTVLVLEGQQDPHLDSRLISLAGAYRIKPGLVWL
jgi:hypothetical protein